MLATISCASATTPLPALELDPRLLVIEPEPEPDPVVLLEDEEEVGLGAASAGAGGGGGARLKVMPPALGVLLEVVEE